MLAIFILVFGLTFVTYPFVSAGATWDLLQATGYAVMALWVYLFIDTGRGRPSLHTFVAWLSLLLLAIHVVGVLTFDSVSAQYLGLEAPDHMLIGLAATGLCVLIVLFAHPKNRRFWHPMHQHFLRYHRIFAWSVLLGAAYHIAGSGFYASEFELVLGLFVISGIALLRLRGKTLNSTLNSWWVLAGAALAISSFTMIRML
ncbi:MAG: hypothetical protein AAF541_20495 [Pseudomonadota bacterium]